MKTPGPARGVIARAQSSGGRVIGSMFGEALQVDWSGPELKCPCFEGARAHPRSGQQRLDVPGELRGERHHDLVGRDRLDER